MVDKLANNGVIHARRNYTPFNINLTNNYYKLLTLYSIYLKCLKLTELLEKADNLPYYYNLLKLIVYTKYSNLAIFNISVI